MSLPDFFSIELGHSLSHIKGRPPAAPLSLSRTTPPTMPSTNITLIFGFLAFVCGQLFSAYLHPSPVKRERVVTVVAVAPGFSLASLVLVVLAVLVIHDAVLILLLHHLAKTDTSRSDPAHIVSKSRKAAADNSPCLRRPTLLLLPPVPVNDPRPSPHSILVGPPRTIWVLPFLKMHRVGVPLIPRPFWTRAIYQQAVCALGPPLFCRLIAHLASGDAPVSGQEFGEDTGMQSIDNSSTVEEKVGEEPEYRDKDVPEPDAPQYEEPLLDDITAPARPSRAPFLRYVAASALLRRLQFRAVDEACYASIEEVKEDDTTKVEEDFEEDIEGEYVGEDVEIVEENVEADAEEAGVEDAKEIEIVQQNVENVKETIDVEIVEVAVDNVQEKGKEPVEEEDFKENVKEEDFKKTVESAKQPVEVPESGEENVEEVAETAEEDSEVEKAAQIADAAQLVQENIETAGKVPVQAAPEVDEETETHSVDAMKIKKEEEEVEDAASEDRVGPDYDYDDLPSYEDFVRDVPLEPLFEEWAPAAPAYACTTTTTTTTRDARTRGSHIGLLSRIRLSSRVSASIAPSA
ncbi:hypothetical protein C8R47DRAFT_1161229 [Mycena vitilis]|nr:hypothetical protein C8R47DRAFT_1161229 [Mycena vitilis]